VAPEATVRSLDHPNWMPVLEMSVVRAWDVAAGAWLPEQPESMAAV
jgi:hypothetical protein